MTRHDAKPREIEFWFDFGSNYSYLAAQRIEALATGAGLAVAWRAFLLGPIFREFGWDTSPFVLQKEKGAYMWRDMERQCAKYGLPWRRPSVFPRLALLPARVVSAHPRAPWLGAFCRAVTRQNFALDQDINAVEQVRAALVEAGVEAEAVLAAAASDATKAMLRALTAEARARGIFGAPTFFARGEMFWGNDRLEDAIACATALPSPAS
jgi:2-hydroxychromene-2-carboxylate isomerase